MYDECADPIIRKMLNDGKNSNIKTKHKLFLCFRCFQQAPHEEINKRVIGPSE